MVSGVLILAALVGCVLVGDGAMVLLHKWAGRSH